MCESVCVDVAGVGDVWALWHLEYCLSVDFWHAFGVPVWVELVVFNLPWCGVVHFSCIGCGVGVCCI